MMAGTKRPTRHLLVDPLVTVDGDTGSSVAYVLMIGSSAEGPYLCAMGTYRDRLERGEDG